MGVEKWCQTPLFAKTGALFSGPTSQDLSRARPGRLRPAPHRRAVHDHGVDAVRRPYRIPEGRRGRDGGRVEERDVRGITFLQDAAKKLRPAGAVYFAMDEADVQRILSYPHTMIGSDGLPHDSHPHPRLWGSFPRVLGHYARELGLFPMEEAIRRMTTLPAERFGLTGRGRLKQNYAADLVLFDPATVKDRATFENPKQVSAGIVGVWVNGKAVWRDGKPTGERPGRPLRRQDMQIALS